MIKRTEEELEFTLFANLGRFLAEGGGDGTRKRFSASIGGAKAADDDGFAYAAPLEVSYKGCMIQLRRTYNLRLLRKLRLEGVRALGPGATEADVQRVAERLVSRVEVALSDSRQLILVRGCLCI